MKLKNIILKNLKKLISLNREEIDINYYDAMDLMKKNSNIILLDVRSVQEYNEYHLDGSINIPKHELISKVEDILEKNNIIIIYCQSGIRSKKACKILKGLGYNNLYNLIGGLDEI